MHLVLPRVPPRRSPGRTAAHAWPAAVPRHRRPDHPNIAFHMDRPHCIAPSPAAALRAGSTLN